MAKTEAALPDMEAVEEGLHQSERADEERTGRVTRLEECNEWTRGVVERRSIAYEQGVPEVIL